jgi:hypothetical protein
LPEDEADGVQAVREVVGHDREEDEHAGCRVEPEREPDPEPVEKAVGRQPGCSERADLMMGTRLLFLVSMVQHQHPLDQEEAEEADANESRHARRIADGVERLREDLEQRNRDDDASRKGDQRLQLAVQLERRQAAEDGRDHGDEPGGDREPAHAQRAQVPKISTSCVSRRKPCFRLSRAAEGAAHSSVSSTDPQRRQTRWW